MSKKVGNAIQIRLTDEIRARAEELATRAYLPLSTWLRMAIEQHIATVQNGAKKGKAGK